MADSPLKDQKVYLLALHKPEVSAQAIDASLEELTNLCRGVGASVAGQMIQSRPQFHPGTVFGSGKLEQIKTEIGKIGVDVVVFDHDLSPSQGQNLERIFGVLVMDRTQIILEIFGNNARTSESRLQVELAQLEYMLPRLVGLWAHLDRERGGIEGSRGTGEKQINIDRSLIRHRIARLRKELRTVSKERRIQKKRRSNCFGVSLVGYTNAGKSTLMNRLTDANVKVENRLFATLDATTRVMSQEHRPSILLSDTVGFINRLPHELVASFRSTLEMVADADLLLHVVDISGSEFRKQIETTETVLADIGAQAVPRLLVFNKLDLVADKISVLLAKKEYPEAIFISATQHDPAAVTGKVFEFFERSMVTTPLQLAYDDYGDMSKIYSLSRVDDVRYEEDGIHFVVTATPTNLERIRSKIPVWSGTATKTG